ncbi:MAG: EF-hand domain-containing protein [Candidatus Poseidoniales archaeon]
MSDENLPTSGEIEVDDAAAYFGVTESSDVLHAMMAMPRDAAMVQFFEILSDIVLRPGDFDFEAASERMQCEGGEIYYLVAGHLGLMSMPDPLLQALGMPDSSGEAGAAMGSINDAHRMPLERLADPMRMMKLFAVAYQTGSKDEVLRYLNAFESMLSDVAGSLDALVAVNKELDAALDVAGHVVPIPSLASGSASAASVDVPESTALPEPEHVPMAAPEPVIASSTPEPETVPLPSASSEPTPTSATVEQSTPLPVASESVALPDLPSAEPVEPEVNVESQKQVAKATHDAFSGAFSSELMVEEEGTPPAPEAPVTEAEPVQASEPEEEFVSAAEHFIAADEDGSGALDVEELAQATGTSLEEAADLHAEADTDGDGVVTLSEFIASPAAEKTASLPKPVAPVRRPLAGREQPAQPAQAPPQRPQPPPQQPWQQQPQQQPQQGWPQQQPQQQPQQGWPQQQPQQRPQQGWPQPQAPLVQPTIRSGVHCRGCGIGLDPYWRFCPVCGQQNLGY